MREQQQEDVRGPLRGLCPPAQPQPHQRRGAGAVPHRGADERLRLLQPGEQTSAWPPPKRSSLPRCLTTVRLVCRLPLGDRAPRQRLLSRNQNSCMPGRNSLDFFIYHHFFCYDLPKNPAEYVYSLLLFTRKQTPSRQ